MKNKILVLIILVVLTIAFSGCGKKGTANTTNQPVVSQSNKTQVSQPTESKVQKSENTSGTDKVISTDNNLNDKSNNSSVVKNQSIASKESISVDEAGALAEEFCRKPNIGVQASHNEKYDIIINNVKYYYFDMIYGLLMGDKPKAEDNVISQLFVSSADKSLFQAVEGKDGGYVLGKALKKPQTISESNKPKDVNARSNNTASVSKVNYVGTWYIKSADDYLGTRADGSNEHETELTIIKKMMTK